MVDTRALQARGADGVCLGGTCGERGRAMSRAGWLFDGAEVHSRGLRLTRSERVAWRGWTVVPATPIRFLAEEVEVDLLAQPPGEGLYGVLRVVVAV